MLKFLSVILFSFALYAESPKVVEVELVKRGNIQRTTALMGTVQAKKSVSLRAHSSGILIGTAQSGTMLKKGEVIAQLDNEDEAKSLSLVEQSERISKDQYERTTLLAKANAINKKELEEAKGQWLVAQKNLLDSKSALEKTQFTAPFDGVVGNYKARENSQVQTNDAVVTFYDPSTMIVEFDIPADVLSKLKSPHHILVEDKTYPLNAIPKIVDPETYMASVHCEIQCEQCFVGEVIEITLPVEAKSNVLLLPNDSVFLKDGSTSVYKVHEGKVELVEVKTGLREKNLIEITEGLEEGDQIVSCGQARLYPDEEVTIAKQSS